MHLGAKEHKGLPDTSPESLAVLLPLTPPQRNTFSITAAGHAFISHQTTNLSRQASRFVLLEMWMQTHKHEKDTLRRKGGGGGMGCCRCNTIMEGVGLVVVKNTSRSLMPRDYAALNMLMLLKAQKGFGGKSCCCCCCRCMWLRSLEQWWWVTEAFVRLNRQLLQLSVQPVLKHKPCILNSQQKTVLER